MQLPPAGTIDRARQLAGQRAEARAAWDRSPDDLDALIWYGRRLAYETRYLDAIAVFTHGLDRHPDEPRLLRHRGHRYISIREFDRAEADLARAADRIRGRPDAVEADGAPNPAGIPRSTRHSNIRYHLGLAQYLRGAFDAALATYTRDDLEIGPVNDDMRVSTGWWTWLARERAAAARGGPSASEAAAQQALLDTIRPDMDLLENFAYHELLLLAKGELTPQQVLGEEGGDGIQDATRAYGVAAWHLAAGRRAQGLELCREIASGPAWMAFGAIAAEAELRRAP